MGLVDSLTGMIGGVFRESLADIIRLETMDSDHNFILKDGTLMSMIRVDGGLRQPGLDELESMVESLRINLAPYMSQPGHAIEVNFLRDADAAREHLTRMVNRSKRTARAAGLDLEDVLQGRINVLSNKVVAETCLISVYTRTSVLLAEESRFDGKKMGERLKNLPAMENAQIPGKALETVVSRHDAFVEALSEGFSKIGQIARVMNVSEALQEIRAGLYPETYPQKDTWHPRLPGWSKDSQASKAPFRMAPERPAEVNGIDKSSLGVETFDRQLATVDSMIETSRTVRIGDMLFQGFDMTVAPEVLPEFNGLVSDITAKGGDIPWRASMRIESGGVQAQSIKAMYLSVFTWAAPTANRRIRDAIQTNIEVDGQTDTIVRFRMSFLTWAPVGKSSVLRRNAQILIGAVKRWGNAGADGISGDPLATVASAMPGLTTGSTANVASGPLRDVISMMPLARQASPWDTGSVLFRTRSGKAWPFQPGSSKQTTWISLFVGTPGSGKSVAMNALNFGSAISPNMSGAEISLPRMAITDIGPSSEGVISMIQEALPANRRHEAVFQKLKMDREFSINVFDTQLGMRRPLSAEKNFLVNFMALVCGDGVNPPSQPMRGLISAAIDRAYEDHMDHRSPRRYLRNDQPIVDQALDETEFVSTPETIWWEVVDHLSGAGRLHEAEVAQRQAVPTLSDLVSASRADQVASSYEDVVDNATNQPILASFQRVISEVIREYPILSSYTRYSIGSARIISLDLMEVTGRGTGAMARKQTALMYMLARQVMTRDYFVDPEEIAVMVRRDWMPQSYYQYHLDRARSNKEIPKIICMDEFHRTGNLEAITDQVLQDAREGRKFNVDIKIASQLPEDFPPAMMEVASTLFVCNAGSEQSIDYISKMYRLSYNEEAIIRNNLTGPSRRGSPIWALFKTKAYGQVRQELLLTLGPSELWALSTTSEDVALRSRLYKAIGPKLARRVLAIRYPGGSAKSDIETRIVRLEEQGERGDDDQRHNVIDELAGELREQALMLPPEEE